MYAKLENQQKALLQKQPQKKLHPSPTKSPQEERKEIFLNEFPYYFYQCLFYTDRVPANGV